MIDVVGLGAAGWSSLGPPERALVLGASTLVGSPRQLDLVPPVPGQHRTPWPRDFRAALPELLAGHESGGLVVLASGDPLVAGVGSTIIEVMGPDVVRVHPAVSSVALARARMSWPAETVETIRLRGDDVDLVRRALFPGRRLVILSRDADSPTEVAALLVAAGFGVSELTVLGDLGAADESRRSARAVDWTGAGPPLHLICVECRAGGAGPQSLAPGLPDAAYDNDGQLSKRDVRASALAHLMPAPGDLLWDVGAGAGSVAIEWMRAHPACRAVAIERDHDRLKRIQANARALGVPGLEMVHGSAPTALAGLPAPDAVFVGGGATAETLDLALATLVPGGRLVVHAVTHETEMIMAERWRQHGGELTRISVEHLERIGSYHGWKPARAVVQWSLTKPR